MQIGADPELRALALDAIRAEYRMGDQRPGMHQSELSYCLTKAFWERTDPMPLTENEALLFSIGFGLERVLLAREVTPETLVVDGISLSLDTIKLFGPADLKTTRLRAKGRKGEDGFQLPEGWKRQFMAYRYGLNMSENCGCPNPERGHGPDCTSTASGTFGVVIIHLVEPEISAYRLHFTHNELVQNWEWLLDRANHLESMLAANDPMPFQFNEEWECGHCRYKLMCDLAASTGRSR